MYRRLAWIDDELGRLEDAHLRRALRTRQGPQMPSGAQFDGRKLVNFGSNDYLGLAADGNLADAVGQALAPHGWGAGASPLLTGRTEWHVELERELARFEQTDDALVFSSGYAANLGTIAALTGPDDAVVSDAKNHASIIDGCRVSGARTLIYPHGNPVAAEVCLQRARTARRRLIVTDGLFSMDGDLAPLAELATLAEQYDAMLMVDEAHATGVFGRQGRGAAEHLGQEDRVDVRVGTLSKALGSVGGFVAGPANLIEYLRNRARAYIFSTAPPAATCAAAVAALGIVREQPERRERLLLRAARLRDTLRAAGWDTHRAESQIVPIHVGEAAATMQLAERLLRHGLLVPGIRPPSVPPGESLLRVSLCHGHGDDEIAQLIAALGEAQHVSPR